MLTDLLLAIAHFLLIFALLAILVTEMVTIRPTMTRSQLFYVARLDIAYGIIAGLILVVASAACSSG
ncbi:MAG: DUF2214 family protein [Bauldia sp.]